MPTIPEFFIISVCRNAQPWIKRCIDSVKEQTFRNWTMVVSVDASTDKTIHAACTAVGTDRRIRVIRSSTRQYALRNMIEGIDRYAPHDSVIVILDGDDWLSDPDALAAVAKAYTDDPAIDILWTRYKLENGRDSHHCGHMPQNVTPLDFQWRTSHLKTFRKRLIWGINRKLWLDEKGNWWRSACDRALYLPLLCIAKKRKFLNRICYVYNRRAAREHTTDEQKRNALSISKNIGGDNHRQRKHKKVLFFVCGPKGGDKRLVWRPGIARQPIGVLTLMARLQARGHQVKLCDRYLNPDWWPKSTLLAQADVVGVYATTANAVDAYAILAHVRKGSRAKLLVGGPHTAIDPKGLLVRADVVCQGEADEVILDLVEGNVKGIITPPRVTNLDTVPFMAHDYVQKAKLSYRTFWPFDNTKPVAVLNTSRGCPHECSFCDTRTIMGREWYGQSPERMVNDMIELRRVTGAKGAYFREDNFCCSKSRLLAFCAEIKHRRLDMAWACEMRADIGADSGIVEMMADAGCEGIYIGFESGSQKMLNVFNKKITVAQSLAAGRNAHKFGIGVAASFIIDHPQETKQDRAATETLIKSLQPQIVWRNSFREPTKRVKT